MKQFLVAVMAFLAVAAFSVTTAEAKSTGSASSGASASKTIVDPASGEKFNIVVMKKHFTTKKAAVRNKPAATKQLMKKTGWGWGWHVVRCGAGAWGGFFASWWLPPWYRVGSMVAGCIVAW
jgi:hypothetical protein